MRSLLLICLTFGVVNAGEFAPAFYEPDLFKSRQIRAQVAMAHSNPYYCNVGQLEWKKRGEYIVKESNAIYISDRVCITCAHCVNAGYCATIMFTMKTGRKVKRHIIKSIVYPDFVLPKEEKYARPDFHKNLQYDIAVLILDGPVEELQDLPINSFVQSNPFYAFSKDDVNLAEPLYVVGYVQDLLWERGLFPSYENKRKSFCFYECARSHNVILSYPYGYRYHCADIRSPVYERPFFASEGIVAPGLSGSALFHPTLGLVAITTSQWAYVNTPLISDRLCMDRAFLWGHEITCVKKYALLTAMYLFYLAMPVYNILYSFMYCFKVEHYLPNHTWFTKPPRISALALMVGGHKEWIDKIRREEIGSDV